MSATSVRALAQRYGLQETKVEVALADTIRHAQPWYVTALAGIGTWVGAFLVALALFTMELFESDGARLICGLAALVAGACASHLNRGVVATQVSMIGAVAGQLLFFSAFGNDESVAIAIGLGVQLAVIAAVDRPLTKALAALAFFGFFLAFLEDHALPADALPIVAALVATGAWLGERALLPIRGAATAVRPVGVASVLALCGFLLFEAVAMSTGVTKSPFTLTSTAALAVALGVIAAVALIVMARRRAGFDPAVAVVVGAAIAVGVGLSLEAPGLVAALLVVVLGVGGRARALVGVGLAFLFAFLALTYYRLDVTLTAKALWAIGTGALLLVVRAFVLARGESARGEGARGEGARGEGAHGQGARGEGARSAVQRVISSSAFLRERRAAQLVVVATLLALGVPFALVVHKERVLASGVRVLLPLAPRDPRSLMQGDYMELRTVVARDALQALHASQAARASQASQPSQPSLASQTSQASLASQPSQASQTSQTSQASLASQPSQPSQASQAWQPSRGSTTSAIANERSGRVVVRVDAERVATFVRLDDGAPLQPDEMRLKFRVRGTRWTEHVRVGAEELFFEEGRARQFEAARFGEVVVDGDGDSVLVGVRDEAKRPL